MQPKAQPRPPAPAAPAEGEWQTVQRRREEQEPFELRAQDWDVPVVAHDAIGRKLDELLTSRLSRAWCWLQRPSWTR